MRIAPQSMSRGEFLRRCSLAAGFVLLRPMRNVRGPGLEHPDPRPGITAEHVLAPEQTSKSKNVSDAYAAARAYPEIFDGLACGCGCAAPHGEHRSLLSCYESRQPTGCYGCQEEAILVGGMAKDGKALAEIRARVDKEYG